MRIMYMEFTDVTKMLKTKTRTLKQNKELSELLIGLDFTQKKWIKKNYLKLLNGMFQNGFHYLLYY